MTDCIPVITLDGPAASGKGTIASRVADALGFHYLDSGALYRIATLDALSKGIDLDDAQALTAAAQGLSPVFEGGRILLDGRDVTTAIRAEEVSSATSRVAVVPSVRAALFALQKNARPPARSRRRRQGHGHGGLPRGSAQGLHDRNGQGPRRAQVLPAARTWRNGRPRGAYCDLEERDRRDSQRATAPLKPAEDARLLDTSYMGIEEVVKKVLEWWDETKKLS